MSLYKRASIAQWQSTALVKQGSWVQTPLGASVLPGSAYPVKVKSKHKTMLELSVHESWTIINLSRQLPENEQQLQGDYHLQPNS